VRGAVSLITICATFLHLAFGCCGHLSHAGGVAACCDALIANGAGDACPTGHDHDHHDEPGHTESPCTASASGGDHGHSLQPNGHGCDGCRCVAKIETGDAFDARGPTVNAVVATLERASIGMLQGARGPCENRSAPIPSGSHVPLFERMVV